MMDRLRFFPISKVTNTARTGWQHGNLYQTQHFRAASAGGQAADAHIPHCDGYERVSEAVESGRVLRGMAGIAWSIRSMGGEPVKAAPHMGRPAAAYRGSPRPSHSAGAFPLAIGISPQRCTADSTLYRCQPLLLLRDATARYRSHSRMAPVPSRIAYAQGLWTETGSRDYPRPGGQVGQ
ncbi:hypothetical protein CABS03_02720 [Colletotrichum abscissum]|uniref:Uncharacterized protein n=1 Tax=Colletotrichum abscissum TaxID=1671311 RepID=A0A9P9X2Q4_9PEZI|nr:hypothetical protein CABS02_13686 [Colletotrichum abscissum]